MQFSMTRLHPLYIGAGVAVIFLCLLSVSAITGLVPSAGSQRFEAPRARAAAVACANCGAVVAIRSVQSTSTPNWRVTVRLDDGSYRTLSQPGEPSFAVGGRVRIVDGRPVALGADR